MKLAAVALIACAQLTWAQARVLAPEKIREIERLITAEMSRQSIPATSIAIGSGSDVIWANGYGLSDLENFVPAKAYTVYRTASIAKPITAVAAMQLNERDKLDLNAPIQKYLPSYPQKKWPITMMRLLGHLGGVRNYRDDMERYSTRHYSSLQEALRAFENDDLIAEPGTKYSYTTYGFVLAGAVVESAAGIPFVDYLKRNIFEPANMQSTRADDVYAIIPNRARGYFRTPVGTIVNAALADTSNKIPGGGLVSTAPDLVRFALALGRGDLLRPESMDRMWTPLKTRDGNPTYYGLGWGIGNVHGREQVSHTGGQAGVASVLRYLPKEQLALAMMFNLEGAQFNELADQILGIALQ